MARCVGVITTDRSATSRNGRRASGAQARSTRHALVHAEVLVGEVRVAGMTVRSAISIHADRHGPWSSFDVAAKLPDAAELCGRREPILEIARSPHSPLRS